MYQQVSPLADYEAGVEDFVMAHVRSLKASNSKSPGSSPGSSNAPSRSASPPKTADELRQEARLAAREKLRQSVFPQISAAKTRTPSTMADKLWGGNEAVEVETLGTGAPDEAGGSGGVVTFAATIEGDASTFDETAFRERVAASLGVDPSSIVLEVGSGNPFTVTTKVSVSGVDGPANVSKALTGLNATKGGAAAAFGVPVASMVAPTVVMNQPMFEMQMSAMPLRAMPTGQGSVAPEVLQLGPEAAQPAEMVQLKTTITGDQVDFEISKYRDALAATLGVDPSEVELSIEPGADGTFVVVASIVVPSKGAAAELMKEANAALADPEAASSVLGVAVASVATSSITKQQPRTVSAASAVLERAGDVRIPPGSADPPG